MCFHGNSGYLEHIHDKEDMNQLQIHQSTNKRAGQLMPLKHHSAFPRTTFQWNTNRTLKFKGKATSMEKMHFGGERVKYK